VPTQRTRLSTLRRCSRSWWVRGLAPPQRRAIWNRSVTAQRGARLSRREATGSATPACWSVHSSLQFCTSTLFSKIEARIDSAGPHTRMARARRACTRWRHIMTPRTPAPMSLPRRRGFHADCTHRSMGRWSVPPSQLRARAVTRPLAARARTIRRKPGGPFFQSCCSGASLHEVQLSPCHGVALLGLAILCSLRMLERRGVAGEERSRYLCRYIHRLLRDGRGHAFTAPPEHKLRAVRRPANAAKCTGPVADRLAQRSSSISQASALIRSSVPHLCLVGVQRLRRAVVKIRGAARAQGCRPWR
jgi:hypothetical protein